MRTRLKNAMVYTTGSWCKKEVLVDGDSFLEVTSSIEDMVFDRVIDCDNSFLLPGFVDVHTHLREPGFAYKETIRTGTEAAARGGYTTIASMPNLNPAPKDLSSLQVQEEIIAKDAVVNVIPYGTITDGSGRGELSQMEEMAEYVIAFSDDGKGVQDEQMMRKAMKKAKELGKIIVAHCEDEAYPTEDPRSEWKQVERDLRLAKETGCAYHVCHISTKESVDLIRNAKAEGVDVSCETAPHYLVLCEDDVEDIGRFKMNPPIRKRADRDALREGLADGTIDMIATDHAPHSADEKKGTFKDSLFGIVGLETAFAVLFTVLVKEEKLLKLEELVDLMSLHPAKRFSLPICQTDLVLVDINKDYEIQPKDFKSMGKATPFEGKTVFGQIKHTMVQGETVYEG